MKKKAEAEPAAEDPLATGFGYLGELLETTNERLQTIIELLQELKGVPPPPPPPRPAGAQAQGPGAKKPSLSDVAKKLEERGQNAEKKETGE